MTNLRKITTTLTGVLLLSVLTLTIGVHSDTAHAATPPDSCFAFNAGTGTITDYYDHEGNNPANPACTKEVDIPSTIGGSPVANIGGSSFSSNQLTGVTIPSSVITIGGYSFANNQITSVMIPNSVTTIGSDAFSNNSLGSVDIPSSLTSIPDYTFSNNKLKTLVLPNSITSIGSAAFQYNLLTELTLPSNIASVGYSAFHANKLKSVVIPDSIVNLSPSAFSLQNEWGGMIDRSCALVDPAPCMWSGDEAEVQRAYDSIWYTRLYTQSANNPLNLKDSILTENNYAWADNNGNGLNDSFGGHLINPSSLTLSYVSKTNNELQEAVMFVGRLASNDYLTRYYADDGPSMPIVMDTENPTPAEQAAIDEALSAYYRIGDSVTINPPAIDGYITPPTQTFVLGAADNTFSYVYTQPESTTPDGASPAPTGQGKLADTGISTIHALLVAFTTIAFGLAAWRLSQPARGFRR